jgi:hypothetical protein
MPVFGGLDAAGLERALGAFGLGPIVAALRTSLPEVLEEVATMARRGELDLDRLREESKKLTIDHFDTLIAAFRALAMAVEALGIRLSHTDPFASDVLTALKQPELGRKRQRPRDAEARRIEEEALTFFAKRRTRNPTNGGGARPTTA